MYAVYVLQKQTLQTLQRRLFLWQLSTANVSHSQNAAGVTCLIRLPPRGGRAFGDCADSLDGGRVTPTHSCLFGFKAARDVTPRAGFEPARDEPNWTSNPTPSPLAAAAARFAAVTVRLREEHAYAFLACHVTSHQPAHDFRRELVAPPPFS